MAFKFNPFTGTLDQTGSGGGGASYIDGEVQNFSALPETLGTPAVDSAYLVREPEGTWLLGPQARRHLHPHREHRHPRRRLDACFGFS
jgi:hypothetical protein